MKIKRRKRKKKGFFECKEWWEDDWRGMPEFIQEDKKAYKTLIIHFKTKEDIDNFSKLIKQKIHLTTRSIWHPKVSIKHQTKHIYLSSLNKNES
jgi:hypothetical protein